ncbi:unnamed protein product [Somion occarium]|uniref:Uncharacterized protein n=1 Tax=Somion occarium TaxID=3059160 RepID=A0ABP1DRE7_9APHY
MSSVQTSAVSDIGTCVRVIRTKSSSHNQIGIVTQTIKDYYVVVQFCDNGGKVSNKVFKPSDLELVLRTELTDEGQDLHSSDT